MEISIENNRFKVTLRPVFEHNSWHENPSQWSQSLYFKIGVEIEGSLIMGTEAGDCDAATGTLIQKAGVARECRSPLTVSWLSRVIHSLGKGSIPIVDE